MKKVAVIMGSDSDLPIVQKAIDTLKAFNVPYEVHIFSAHRTPGEAAKFAQNAQSNGFGIPCKSNTLDGIDALLSTVQMPSGIPVATVAINGAVNAALLSVQILALCEPELSEKLSEKRASDSAAVLEKDKNIASNL